jgi:glycosyltransferase involved in cell wall biosynthesis
MACGCITVASNTALKEVLPQELQFEEGNAKSLANTLEHLAHMSAKIDEQCPRVCGNWHWRNIQSRRARVTHPQCFRMKTVLYFGLHDPAYARTRVIQLGFERNGWQIEDCRVDPKKHRGLGKYVRLFLLGLKAKRRRHDLVIVGFPGQTVVWLARLLFGPGIIFDAYLSIYDSNVFDRKVYPANSLRAKKDKWIETWSCRLAHKIFLETNQHIEYFVETFGIPREKFERIWISADDSMFFPTHVPEEARFTVQFHGTYIPLQGISYIVRAANILRDEDIHFRIIGGGQEYEMIQKLVMSWTSKTGSNSSAKFPWIKFPAIWRVRK